MQIACRCGLPPSQIAQSWSADELQDAEVLADLEGWGQEKRRTARLCAEIHNASIQAHWSTPNQAPPHIHESMFLTRKVRKLRLTHTVENPRIQRRLNTMASIMNKMAGFGRKPE